MRASALFVGLTALAALAIAGCGSDVATESSTSGSGGGSGGGGGGGGAGSCGDNPPVCVQTCSSDAILAPECSSSGWVCPEGSIDIGDCPVGSCVGKPPPCHECQMGAWTCSPGLCIDACPEVMCDTCGPNSQPIQTATCSCACNEAGQFVCKKTPDTGCCMVDSDCGDFAYVPCVNGVCKANPPDGFCWANGQCSEGTSCGGAFVCPCGEQCDTEDKPGFCEGPPP